VENFGCNNFQSGHFKPAIPDKTYLHRFTTV
jgi:hypothetical protein